LPLRAGARVGSGLSRRRNSRLTVDLSHLPSRAVGISRSFNSRAMALLETMPALRSFRIVGAKPLARTSAARLCDSPLLILPFVTKPRRARTLATVVGCHLPPSLVGVSLRFNSFASAGWDTNPAAISSLRVEAKARARESAARLTAKGPNIPFFRDDVCPRAVFIGHHGRAVPRRLMSNLCRGLLKQ
jgi:hypothetical protein